MDVSSTLSLDTNVVVVGERVTIRVSEQQEGGDDYLAGSYPISATSNPSTEVEIVEVVDDEITPDRGWEKETVVPESHCHTRANFLVIFLPREAIQYKLEVKCRGSHVPGSPFSIVAISRAEKEGLVSPEVVAGEPVTFTLPKNWNCRAVSPTVWVGGPQGQCEVFNRFGNDSFSFFPNQPGAYIISLQSEEAGSKEEKYCITAKSNDMGAKKCYVVESDKYLFQKPIRFTNGCGVSFRVHTSNAFGTSLLRVVARGPSGANVTITESKVGEESVLFQPSSPGRYTLDILWSGQHIQDSPLTVHFRKPRSRVESNGLNLSKEVLIIDTPFRFKLKSEEEDIQINCEPSSAALVKVTPALSDPNMYLCEIVPRECGTHYISVQLHGMHIPGSPFPVHFRHRGNPLQCQLESTLERVQNDPTLKFYVNTEGAGEGTLTAVAIDEITREKMVGTVTQLDGGRHMVELTPGGRMECKLGVLYDGQHIPGSPFSLLFPGAASFSVEGDGVIRTRVNQWSQFEVHSINAGPGELSVSIEGPNNTTVVPIVTTKDPSVFDVHYLPNKEGQYRLFIRWGQHQIPGSPFTVECVSDESLSHFTIWRPSKRIPFGSSIEFTVEDGRTDREKLREKDSLCVEAVAIAQHTSEVLRAETSKDSDGNICCQFQPPDPGTYSVTVRCRGMEIPGSPFRVTVPSPPRAERVRVWGKGLQDHQLALHAHGSKFMVDTTDAGSGVLLIKVCESVDKLDYSWMIILLTPLKVRLLLMFCMSNVLFVVPISLCIHNFFTGTWPKGKI